MTPRCLRQGARTTAESINRTRGGQAQPRVLGEGDTRGDGMIHNGERGFYSACV